jgi:hypothetical protein
MVAPLFSPGLSSIDEEKLHEKMRSDDRVFTLKPIPGAKALKTVGIVDSSLFTGSNQLHAKRDPQFSFWKLNYSNGGNLPEPLQQTFTSFSKLVAFITEYYKRRNVTITEIHD